MTRSGRESYYYLTDATGKVLGAVDQAATRTHTYAYTPTGTGRATPTETVPQPYRFAGAYNDPTGLHRMGARYYGPALGRFTQPDPSGQEKNAYLYAGDDPINRTDPSGLLSFSDVLDTGSDILGVVSGCVAGVGAAAETGVIAYAAAAGGVVGAGVGSAVGTGAAVVTSCALGGAAGYYGADITSYG